MMALMALGPTTGCGERQGTGTEHRAIINGTDYPNHSEIVLLVIAGGSGDCTGVFIGEKLVLTAKHCIIHFFVGVPAPVPWQNITICDGDEAGQGCTNQVSSIDRVHLSAQNDIALLETDQPCQGTPRAVADGGYLPTKGNITAFEGELADIVGYSDNGSFEPSDGKKRRQGRMTIVGITSVFDEAFMLEPTENQQVFGGDSGGPVLRNDKVIGVISGFAKQGYYGYQGDYYGCENPSTDPLACLARAAYIDTALITQVDGDHDGIGSTTDNCPSDPNIEQRDCDEDNVGDACDPDPCLYIQDVAPVTGFTSNPNVVWQLSHLRVKTRAVGFDDNTQEKTHINDDMDAYYCACHEWNDPTPKEPQYIDPQVCKNTLCQDSADPNASNPLRDTGWHRVIWGHYDDSYDFSPTNFQLCPPGNNDSDGANNDCLLSLQDRLYRRPFHDPGLAGMGALPGDWDDYWSETGKDRTRYFRWDWRKADYPHRETDPWFPYMGEARVRLWVRHANQTYPAPLPHNYTKAYDLFSYGKPKIEAFRQVYPWEELCVLNPRRLLGPLDLRSDVGPLVMHPIDLAREVPPELEPFIWQHPPEDAAIKGLIITRFNHKSGDFGAFSRSEVVEGVPPFTKSFAATRWEETEEIFVFGGASSRWALPAILWHASPQQVGDEVVYFWNEVPGEHPAGRTGALLVSDIARNRLLLMYGMTEDRRSSADVFAFDRSSGNWSSVRTEIPDLAPVDAAGFTHDNERLFVYGGRRDDEVQEGLYVIGLHNLIGERVDSETPGPGPRMGVALHHDPAAEVVYLFGGSGSRQVYNDLWRFDLKRRVWTRVTSGAEPGAPPLMTRASLIVSPVDGAASVLAGPREEGPGEPMWQLWAGGWKTAADLQVEKPD